jgi:hypothetical protein
LPEQVSAALGIINMVLSAVFKKMVRDIARNFYILKLWLVLFLAGGDVVRSALLFIIMAHTCPQRIKKIRSVHLLFTFQPFTDITRFENGALSSASNGAHFYAIEYCV